MSDALRKELAATLERAAYLERQIEHGACDGVGHDWVRLGGCNAACCEDCRCSVPVHECRKCGDCDYGDNDEATKIKSLCNKGFRP